jgi:hypothetical protein
MRLFTLSRAISVLLAAGVSLPVAVVAQSQDTQSQQAGSQDSSVAAAARRNRDKKKNPSNQPKSPKVITDDDLDKRNFQPGQEGLNVGSAPRLETGPPSTKAVAAAEAADAAADDQDAKDAADQDRQIGKLKEQVSDAEKDLDLGKRQLALDQDSYFSNPDYSHDAAGKTRLQDEKQQIDDKQQEIERLKAKLAALEEAKSHRKTTRTQAAPAQTETPPNAPPQF